MNVVLHELNERKQLNCKTLRDPRQVTVGMLWEHRGIRVLWRKTVQKGMSVKEDRSKEE